MRQTLFLTNDDGMNAPGIQALVSVLNEQYDCWVVAPHRERSGAAHSITISEPLDIRLTAHSTRIRQYTCTGTPVDCVKIGLSELMPRQPDFLISGINAGLNTGRNILYSGTVAAAVEGAFQGIPSLAVSADTLQSPKYPMIAAHLMHFLKMMKDLDFPSGFLLNLNYPSVFDANTSRMVLTQIGKSIYQEEIQSIGSANRHKQYRIRGFRVIQPEAECFDQQAVNDGAISVTPLKDYTYSPELTDYLSNKFDFLTAVDAEKSSSHSKNTVSEKHSGVIDGPQN